MRCHICDCILPEPKYNHDIGQYDPCDVCMEVVEDTLAGFLDRPAVAEDELGNDLLLEGLFPSVYEPFEDVDFT